MTSGTPESRSVVVRLSMEASQYVREAQRAGVLGEQAMTRIEKGAKKSSASLESTGRAAGQVGLLAAAGVGVLVGAAARFDKSMSAVQAATHETVGNMGLLRQAALDAGKDTVYSATESAGAIEELAKAGVSTADILGGGLAGSLNLAAGGALDVGEAAEIAASALTQFHLAGSDVSHVADLLAAGAGKAQGSVHDLGAALNQSGLVASQTGLSIEETSAALAAFASNGLTGSDAGTSFKTMLLALNPQSEKAADLMDQIGFSAYDASGQFVGMEELARRLQASLAGMSEQQRNATLQTLFGRDAIRAANVLYTEGAKGIADWTAKVDDQGYAAETASTRLDNLAGDVEQLTGSLETLFIGAGEGSQGPLRKLVQGTRTVVDALNELPPSAQGAVTGLLGITALTGGGIWLGTKVVSKVTDLNSSLNTLSETAPRTAKSLRLLAAAGIALAGLEAAGAVIDTIHDKAVGAAPAVEKLTAALLEADQTQFNAEFGQGIQDALDNIDPSGVDGLADSLNNLADKAGPVGRALETGLGQYAFGAQLEDTRVQTDQAAQAFTSLDQALAGLVASGGPEKARAAFESLADSQGLTADEQKQLLDLLPNYSEALQGSANDTQLAADATDDYAKSTYRAKDGTDLTAAALKKIRDAYQDARKDAAATATSFLDIGNKADKTKVSLREWIHQMEEQAKALEEFTANAIKAGKRGLDDGLIAKLEELGPVGALRMKQLANATDAEIDRANRAWERGQKAVDAYVDATVKVPKELSTTLTVENAQALQHVRDVSVALHGLKDKTIYVTTVLRTVHQEGRLGPIHSATGGQISGPGSSTSDSIPALLSDGEYVIRAAAVDHYGTGLFDRLNAIAYAHGGPVHLAAGGPASTADSQQGLIAKILAALQGSDLGDGAIRGFMKAVDELRHALSENKGKWNDDLRDQAHSILKDIREAEHDRAQAIREAFTSLATDLEQGAHAIRTELADLKSDLKAAGGVWDKELRKHAGKILDLAKDYDQAAALLQDQQAVLGTLINGQHQMVDGQGQILAQQDGLVDLLGQQAALVEQAQSQFRHDIFGQGAQGAITQLQADANDANAFNQVLQQLQQLGLDGPALQALMASGDLNTAQQLAAGGTGLVDLFEQSFAGRESALSGLGDTVGAVLQPGIDAQLDAIANQNTLISGTQQTMTDLQVEVRGLRKELRDLADANKEGSRQGSRQGTREGIKEAFASLPGR